MNEARNEARKRVNKDRLNEYMRYKKMCPEDVSKKTGISKDRILYLQAMGGYVSPNEAEALALAVGLSSGDHIVV